MLYAVARVGSGGHGRIEIGLCIVEKALRISRIGCDIEQIEQIPERTPLLERVGVRRVRGSGPVPRGPVRIRSPRRSPRRFRPRCCDDKVRSAEGSPGSGCGRSYPVRIHALRLREKRIGLRETVQGALLVARVLVRFRLLQQSFGPLHFRPGLVTLRPLSSLSQPYLLARALARIRATSRPGNPGPPGTHRPGFRARGARMSAPLRPSASLTVIRGPLRRALRSRDQATDLQGASHAVGRDVGSAKRRHPFRDTTSSERMLTAALSGTRSDRPPRARGHRGLRSSKYSTAMLVASTPVPRRAPPGASVRGGHHDAATVASPITARIDGRMISAREVFCRPLAP